MSSAVESQRALIEAALSPGGPRAVVQALARALDCWCLALDESAGPRYAAPPQCRRHAAGLRLDLERLRLGSPLHTASLNLNDQRVSVLPIGADGRVSGYLAAGRDTPLSPAEHSVLTSAAGLLSLDLAGQRALSDARRGARRAVLDLAAGGHPDMAVSVAETLGLALPAAPVRVAVLGTAAASEPGGAGGIGGGEPAGTAGTAELLRAAEGHPGLAQAAALVVRHEQHTVVIVLPVAEGDQQALEEVLHRVPRSRGVITDGVPFAALPDALRRARSVFFGTPRGAGGREAGRLVLAKDVATAGLLAQLDTPGARGWADALLEPLDRHAHRSRLDLVSTLRVFLANNGHVDASAAVLGIHRHTMRYRLGRIVELLGSDLDDPTARAELWLALRLRDSGRGDG